MVTKPRDRAADGLLTLLGDIPELVSNLVKAEIEAAKAWLRRVAKDAQFGAIWGVVALFVLFWMIPMFFTVLVIVLDIWWPLWVAALVVFGVLLLTVALFALLSFLRFKKLVARENPVQAVQKDARLMKESGDDDF